LTAIEDILPDINEGPIDRNFNAVNVPDCIGSFDLAVSSFIVVFSAADVTNAGVTRRKTHTRLNVTIDVNFIQFYPY
jgi:hypothetical protein